MLIKEQLFKNFQELITKTNKKSFTEAKLKFYEALFLNYSDEDNLYLILTAFEMSCDDFINTNYSDRIKNILLGDFQMILVSLDAFQPAK